MERYLLWVRAVPVDAVPLRWSKPGADADNEAQNPNQIHGGEVTCREWTQLWQVVQKKKKKFSEKRCSTHLETRALDETLYARLRFFFQKQKQSK